MSDPPDQRMGLGEGGGGGFNGLPFDLNLSGADSAAILELSRLSPEEMAAVLSAAGLDSEAQSSFATNAESIASIASSSSSIKVETPAAGPVPKENCVNGNVSARPDLVRLADLVTHASLVLAQPTAAGPRKYTRSRRGCLTCRSRKVKCDEVRPSCLRCAAMGRECTWDEEKVEKKKPPRKKSADGPKPTAGPSKGADTPTRRESAPSAVPPVNPQSTSAAYRKTSYPSLPYSTATAVGSSVVPPIPAGAPAPATPSAAALAAAGLPPSLAKALAELAHTRSESPDAGTPAGMPWVPPLPPQTQQLPQFKPQPPGCDRGGKRQRNNQGAAVPQSELAGLPFDFASWVANVGFGEGGAGPSSQTTDTSFANVTRVRTGSSDEVIELSRSSPDAQGRIRLERAAAAAAAAAASASTSDAVLVLNPDDVAGVQASGDIRLALSGKLVRRRHPGDEDEKTDPVLVIPPTAPKVAPAGVGQFYMAQHSLLPDLDPFMHAFPTASTRGLFKHYVDCTSGIVTALGRSKPRENPFLQVSVPLVLADMTSPGSAALRFSLLTTSAAHIFHLRGGDDAADLCDRLKRLAIGYTVISQSEADDERRAKEGTTAMISEKTERDNDLVLAACVILVTRDVLSADRTWRANLDFALSAIRRRGGPEAVMARDPTSFMRRFVLEQLATHEVFSCFTTGGEPTLLQTDATWWFDVEKSSSTNWEWESIENQFGISRSMVEVVARICTLAARKNRLGPAADLSDPDLVPVAVYLRTEAEAIISELDLFAVSLRSLPQQRRVQYGDHIYRLAMTLHLMTEILCLPATDPRVRAIVPAALELCSEISLQPVMLVWPLLMIARVCVGEEREWMRGLLGTYSDQYCRDLQTAQELIFELWKRQDEGVPVKSWHTLMQDVGKDVLLI